MTNKLPLTLLMICSFSCCLAQEDQNQPAQPSFIDSRITQLTNQLNKCRSIYKQKVANNKSQLENAKQNDVLSVPELTERLQKEVDDQAKTCKEIKAEIETAKQNKSVYANIQSASPSEEVGPTVRCFRLGQNWKQFSQCATSLGLNPSIELNQNFMTSIPKSPMTDGDFGSVVLALAGVGVAMKAFEDMPQLFFANLNVFSAGPVWGLLDKKNTVQLLYIGSPQFFGTSTFDKNFLEEFKKNYKIGYLDPVHLDLPQEGGLYKGDGVYYQYVGDGWLVKVSNENLGRFVAFLKTGSQKRNYTF